MTDLTILVPVYNDAECLRILCAQPVFRNFSIQFVVVNDGSHDFEFQPDDYPFPIQVIHLHANMGHQKAIAVGLSYIFHYKKTESILVMDADGEDNPDQIELFLKASRSNAGAIIFARRIQRTENLSFRLGYKLYKILFRLLTGHAISFGNYVLIPSKCLKKLVYKNDIWNHLAAGILKSGLPIITLPLKRNKRFTGNSKMRFSKLVLHGLGAITVFIEFVSTRLLTLSIVLLLLTTVAIGIIIGIKAFTDLAIPGWASTLTGVMMIIFLQSFLLTLSTLVLYLSSQAQRQLIPAVHYEEFISEDITA